MLTLQNLDLDTHVRLKKNEILEKELQFYNAALNTISTSSAVLAGFAFSGLAMSLENEESDERLLFRTFFTISSTLCVALNLITLCAATFASLYSVRLALRGADDSVEKSVKAVRGEYKFVLFLFCCGIFAFFMSISLMGFYKFHSTEAIFMLVCGIGGICVVGFLMKRAANKFYLSKSQRYLSNKEMKKSLGNRQTLNDHQHSLNVPPEEGIPYTRMAASKSAANNSNLTDSDRSNPGPRKSSLLGTLTSSFRSNKNATDSPSANKDNVASNV
ncbi:hypothetical protein TrCOL_g10648 [Triparma columacea]|uniref:Uncharacterized protein n=1 Tax=Triparma columacea TaxID=722753 RepID=A0A9W7GAN1_9STRA|nr:hypothetical protein TrCOL_g10648 [Triparma columacea]